MDPLCYFTAADGSVCVKRRGGIYAGKLESVVAGSRLGVELAVSSTTERQLSTMLHPPPLLVEITNLSSSSSSSFNTSFLKKA